MSVVVQVQLRIIMMGVGGVLSNVVANKWYHTITFHRSTGAFLRFTWRAKQWQPIRFKHSWLTGAFVMFTWREYQYWPTMIIDPSDHSQWRFILTLFQQVHFWGVVITSTSIIADLFPDTPILIVLLSDLKRSKTNSSSRQHLQKHPVRGAFNKVYLFYIYWGTG